MGATFQVFCDIWGDNEELPVGADDAASISTFSSDSCLLTTKQRWNSSNCHLCWVVSARYASITQPLAVPCEAAASTNRHSTANSQLGDQGRLCLAKRSGTRSVIGQTRNYGSADGLITATQASERGVVAVQPSLKWHSSSIHISLDV